MSKRLITIAIIAVAVLFLAFAPGLEKLDFMATALADDAASLFDSGAVAQPEGPPEDGGAPQTPLWDTDWSGALNVLITLLLASVLSGLVSFRSRGGTSQMDFTEAHIVLSAAAALMMMIIGSQIARAFGLMGAASIVRYRYSLKSPKEASSLVIALGIGMACGVGLFSLAVVTSVFIVFVVNFFEHMPSGLRRFLFAPRMNWRLRIRTTDPEGTLDSVKSLFDSEKIGYRISRIRGERGPERDQTEINIILPGNIDRNEIADNIISEGIIRIEWKRIEKKRRVTPEIE